MTQQKPILPPQPPEGFKPKDYAVGVSRELAVNPSAKHWYQSRVVWFNIVVIGASLATTATPALEQHMSPESYGVLTAIVGVVNAVLRLATSRPIANANNDPLPPIEGSDSE